MAVEEAKPLVWETKEPEEEPFTQVPSEHPLLDGDHADYQHAPETGGLDYAGELTDESESKSKKGAKSVEKSAAKK